MPIMIAFIQLSDMHLNTEELKDNFLTYKALHSESSKV